MTYLPPEQRPLLVDPGPTAPQQPAPPGYYLPQPRRRPKHPVAQLEPFRWMDLATVLTYIAVMLVGLVGLIGVMIFGRARILDGGEVSVFLINFVSYAVCFVLVLISLKRELWKSFKTFLWYPWAKFPSIVGAWIACLVITAVLIAIFAEAAGVKPEDITQSQNQQAADSMMSAVSFVPMALMTVVMGPLVEEFLFRHLLIGKLSGLLTRRLPRVAKVLNPWVLMVVSAFAFACLHFIGSGEVPTLLTGTPYLLMGISFGTGYLLAGRSIAYSYSMHAFSNLMAVGLGYLIGAAS